MRLKNIIKQINEGMAGNEEIEPKITGKEDEGGVESSDKETSLDNPNKKGVGQTKDALKKVEKTAIDPNPLKAALDEFLKGNFTDKISLENKLMDIGKQFKSKKDLTDKEKIDYEAFSKIDPNNLKTLDAFKEAYMKSNAKTPDEKTADAMGMLKNV
jgi:hypothetical protein